MTRGKGWSGKARPERCPGQGRRSNLAKIWSKFDRKFAWLTLEICLIKICLSHDQNLCLGQVPPPRVARPPTRGAKLLCDFGTWHPDAIRIPNIRPLFSLL